VSGDTCYYYQLWSTPLGGVRYCPVLAQWRRKHQWTHPKRQRMLELGLLGHVTTRLDCLSKPRCVNHGVHRLRGALAHPGMTDHGVSSHSFWYKFHCVSSDIEMCLCQISNVILVHVLTKPDLQFLLFNYRQEK